jgi:hypothetical protein
MSVKTRKRTDRRDAALDVAFDAYLGWRARCDALQRAYDEWVRARLADAARAFRAYERALDREAGAADAYAAALAAVDASAWSDAETARRPVCPA